MWGPFPRTRPVEGTVRGGYSLSAEGVPNPEGPVLRGFPYPNDVCDKRVASVGGEFPRASPKLLTYIRETNNKRNHNFPGNHPNQLKLPVPKPPENENNQSFPRTSLIWFNAPSRVSFHNIKLNESRSHDRRRELPSTRSPLQALQALMSALRECAI